MSEQDSPKSAKHHYLLAVAPLVVALAGVYAYASENRDASMARATPQSELPAPKNYAPIEKMTESVDWDARPVEDAPPSI